VRFVFAEGYVPGQRQPVHLRHFCGHAGARKRWRRIETGGGAVEASQIERVRRLRIVQIDLGTTVARNCFEAIRVASGQDRHECREGLGIHLAKVVVREGFRKARALIGVTRFIAVGAVHRLLLVEMGLRRCLPDAEGRYLAC
jgi:hypothetical protein